jgi:transposase
LRERNLREERTPMERYIGLDVHAQSTTVAVVGPSGKRLRSVVVETTGKELIEAIGEMAGKKRVCLEEGTQSEWLYEILSPHVEEVVVFVGEAGSGTKSDEGDAWAMAEKLRVGGLKTRVFKAKGEFAELRAAVRGYEMVQGDVVRVKNRLRSMYRARGLQAPAAEVYQPERRAAWLAKLPTGPASLAGLLSEELDALEVLRNNAEAQLVKQAAKHGAVERLATAPAIGTIRAALIVATVVTPHRFRTKRQFWSYCGLGIVTRSSADWVRGTDGKLVKLRTSQARGLNQNRNPLLKRTFKGAAHQICTQMTKHPLHQHYTRLVEAGGKPNLAKLTIARRLAATILALWKHEEDYDPAKHVIAQTR